MNPERLAGRFVLLSGFAVYLLTLAPEVTFWDSGELVLGAAALGIPHPPAYPVFCIIGKAFSLLPLGNLAYRLNIMSAVLGALSVYALYRLALEMGGEIRNVALAVAASLSFAFASPFWSQTVITEVYALNTLFLAAIAYLLLRFDREHSPAHLHASAFFVGLAAATHQSIVFLLPAYCLFFILSAGKERAFARTAWVRGRVAVFFALLGYSAVLYMPVRAAAGPAINIGDPSTLYGFKWVLKLSEHMMLVRGVPLLVSTMAGNIGLTALLAGLSVVAAAVWALRKRAFMLFSFLAAVSYFIGMKTLMAGSADIEKWGLSGKFYVPALLFGILVAVAVISSVAERAARDRSAFRLWYSRGAWALMVVPIWLINANLQAVDHSKDFFAFDFGTNTLKSVKQDAAIVAWGDNGVFPVWYLQGLENYRDDVLFLHTELLTHYWYTNDVSVKLMDKYGIRYIKPKDLLALSDYMPVVTLMLEKRTPTYFDYSAAARLNVKLDKLAPQGLARLSGPWKPEDIGSVWDRYVLRGAFDETTNRAFAAEGILDIYAYECAVWARQAYRDGHPEEALRAYGQARKLGLINENFDKWADQVRAELFRDATN